MHLITPNKYLNILLWLVAGIVCSCVSIVLYKNFSNQIYGILKNTFFKNTAFYISNHFPKYFCSFLFAIVISNFSQYSKYRNISFTCGMILVPILMYPESFTFLFSASSKQLHLYSKSIINIFMSFLIFVPFFVHIGSIVGKYISQPLNNCTQADQKSRA